MSGFQRFAIYYLPDDPVLAAFGASWLGWDITTGEFCTQPAIDGIEGFTLTPGKYGFHGTLKPPFRLAEGTRDHDLSADVARFAERTAAIKLDGLRPSQIGSFLALVPQGDTADLARLAFDCVREFDVYRRPADQGELERRRKAALTDRQNQLLVEWGYPYVADEFRFHMTLTGKLAPPDRARAQGAIDELMPDVPQPYAVNSICLVGERPDKRFQLIHRYTLTG